MNSFNWEIYSCVFVGFMLIITTPGSYGFTDPGDVAAINSLYTSLENPTLPGWTSNGGDPCLDAWQGVQCVDSKVVAITINAANLGGELGDNLGSFASITTIDFSNNHIGGSIPSNLPVTAINIFLSANQFSGSIPDSLSSLTQLAALSLNENLLTGEIPDAFQALTGLVNLDLSSNNLSGQLPSTVKSLSSLTTLRLQNNQLSGTLDVLEDLPLRDLNIENNLFSGPIPENLLNIPSFKKDGNPFNTSSSSLSPPPIVPSPPLPTSPGRPFFPPLSGPPTSGTPTSGTPATGTPTSGTPTSGTPTSGTPTSGTPTSGTPTSGTPTNETPVSGTPTSDGTSGRPASGPSTQEQANPTKTRKFTTKKIAGIAIAGVLGVVIIICACILFMLRCGERTRGAYLLTKRHHRSASSVPAVKPRDTEYLGRQSHQIEKVPKEPLARLKDRIDIGDRRMGAIADTRSKQETESRFGVDLQQKEGDGKGLSRMDTMDVIPLPPPPPPPPPPPSVEKVLENPILPSVGTIGKPPPKNLIHPTSVRSFTVASLQQFTNSFSQENLIGGGMLGSVYRAELPDGKLLAVKKLDSIRLNDEAFLEIVSSISRLKHVNVLELVGYCSEHRQRLLIYDYCSNGTLHDALHSDNELNKTLSWNKRVRMATEAARALEYLHEVCHPPVVHRNFKSANILLDDELTVLVSDCGLGPLIASGSVAQLSGQLLSTYGYGAPEFEHGTYTHKSDVYSFGVVMLELLTGRKSYDRSVPRGEQFLVRWAMPQLHDIEELAKMVDPSLNGVYPAKSLSRFADIISLCIQQEPEFRPPMSEIVQKLSQLTQRNPGNSSSE